MSNISSFTGRFRAHKNTNQAASTKVVRRPRESTVCTHCRASKLKCDRGQPACGNCLKKGEGDACIYDRAIVGRSEQKRVIAEDRLAHLESLVKDLIEADAAKQDESMSSRHPFTPERTPPDGSPGQIDSVENDGAQYFGFTHWSAVLDEIDGLKTELSDTIVEDDFSNDAPAMKPDLGRESIFGSPRNYSLQEIIYSYLPPKSEADRLLAVYFQGENFILPFVHVQHFQHQYQQFWADTSAVNPLWLSILFSIFRMGSMVRASTTPTSSTEDLAKPDSSIFHVAAGQCLVVGRYHQPQEYVVEALVMYAHCKSMVTLDPLRETGAILAMAVRSAYQLAYHRDPDLFKNFTPFEGEMRRRAWAVCKQMDLMVSFQLGLPSSICLENCDTRSLGNILDVDFGPDSKTLPLSRPDYETTRLLWFVVKDRMMVSFAKVCRDALSHVDKSQCEIQDLDEEIRKMKTKVPEPLKLRPMSESIGDSPFIIVTRYYLEFIYLKSLCVLHRRYMARGDLFSTDRCLNAGMTLVNEFLDLYRELSPEGLLCNERWMLNSYSMNDFLLGTTILCLYLHGQLRKNVGSIAHAVESQDEVVSLLNQAYQVCIEKSDACNGARRVAQVIHAILKAFKSANSSSDYKSSTNASTISNPSLNLSDSSLILSDDRDNLDMNLNIDPFDFLQTTTFTGDTFGETDWAMFDPLSLGQDMMDTSTFSVPY